MAKGLVLYISRTDSTRHMGEAIAFGMITNGMVVDCRSAVGFNANDLQNYDAIVIGSPTQYGSMAWEIKKLFDDSSNLHYKLDSKIGGAFSSSCHVGGGNETTILGILHAMLIHGMVVQGEPMYDHYGATSLTNPSEDNIMKCKRYGERIANLVKRCS